MWLASPVDCPKDALGFDFDSATFTHTGAYVSFEVLVASFGLEQAALKRLGALVHYLDAGGIQPPEANGVESVRRACVQPFRMMINCWLRHVECLTDSTQLLKRMCNPHERNQRSPAAQP